MGSRRSLLLLLDRTKFCYITFNILYLALVLFDKIVDEAKKLGYQGLTHTGGKTTGTKAHNVKVYFVGNGSSTPVVEEVNGYYENYKDMNVAAAPESIELYS